ncbi:2-phospho-L-lactate guanylyltransferase [Microbacterium sp. JZ37]|uniref:2-phospho-L-lactate guanylyltransferase n=1 Tax=Microbacterium sp. JZ37 TaxID=2654193 RepID=UPI002B467A00|nr:2-phospho-L-lactate guanylyltransferase [Microbacterium sp. JZ37]WRH16380.1 2-phospho-L-lactate guanylyltransferase [Microbacterium sp. JZ37]
MNGDAGFAWHVVIPVKPPARGKSRLEAPGVDRAALADAIARDTVDAVAHASRVAEVVVVTAASGWPEGLADSTPARARPSAPIRVVRESEPAGLNAAIRRGLATIDRVLPRAVLLGDLPALRPADLDAALALAGAARLGLVADAEGAGSTLITARAGTALVPAFGADSAAAHRAAGHVDLGVAQESTLRRDVDTVEQLRAAAALGLGSRTATLLG